MHVHCTKKNKCSVNYLGNACQPCTELTQVSMLSWLNKHVKFGFQFSGGSSEKDCSCWKFNLSREIMQAIINLSLSQWITLTMITTTVVNNHL